MEKNLSFSAFLKKRGSMIAIALLLLMFVLEISSVNLESQIIDEGVHLTAGYSYLVQKEIVLNPEHPPLAKILPALLIAPMNPAFPWDNLENSNQWNVAGQFFYDVGNNADKMLFWGRLPAILFSLILGWLIFIWCRELAGSAAGLMALLLYIFDPNILAHSRYITTDIAITLGFVSSLYFFYKYTQNPSKKNLLLFAIIFALTQVIKFSALLLWPLIIFYGLISTLKAKNYLYAIISAFLATVLVIVVVYFFQPFPYIEGIKALAEHEAGGHYSYLMGEYDEHGFWYYFPFAFLVKTPLLTLFLLIISISLFINYIKNKKQIVGSWFAKLKQFIKNIPLIYWMIVGFPVFYFIISMINRINIGIRHLLPIYPFIFMFISITLYKIKIKKIKIFKIIFSVLIAGLIIESIIIYPNYLPYFSPLIGGSNQGHKYLLDSNLDWGQDLKKLKNYLNDNNISDPVYLSYFGKASPDYYEINHLPLEPHIKKGWIAISIQKMLLPEADYNWLLEKEPVAKIGGSIYLYHIQ